jgi:outer membrane PBP1 activator LpoA protein
MRTLAYLAPVLLALTVAGCTGAQTSSSPKFKGDRKAVADVVEKLQTASQARKANQICSDILSRRLAGSFRA